jgi:NitT/TauT family transport system permease protein
MAEQSVIREFVRAGSLPRSAPSWRWLRWLLSPLVALLILLIWHGVTTVGAVPEFILPAPGTVLQTLVEVLGDGSLLRHAQVTLGEVILGLVLGLAVAISLGYLLAKSYLIERLLAPYIVALQAVPIVAIAPILIIWLGSGTSSKVITGALIVFFPMLINTIVGVRQVEPDLGDLMNSLGASRWQTFWLLEVPAALPVLLGGLKVSATLAVIGAVVGEFVGASAGLGFLINVARSVYDTTLVYVAVFALTLMALTLYGLVDLLEGRLLAWQRAGRPR